MMEMFDNHTFRFALFSSWLEENVRPIVEPS